MKEKHIAKGWIHLARPPVGAHRYEKIEFEQSIKYAEESMDKDLKFRWHDLRKNPDDLPDTKRYVEVRTEDNFPYYFGWYDTESEVGMWYGADGFLMDPVKWREIEEEVEG